MSVLAALNYFYFYHYNYSFEARKGASGSPFITLSLFPISTVRVIIPSLRSSQLIVRLQQRQLVGKQLPGCGIQYKWKGVVLSPLLVITVIIMEISQQAPEASLFIGSL